MVHMRHAGDAIICYDNSVLRTPKEDRERINMLPRDARGTSCSRREGDEKAIVVGQSTNNERGTE